MGFRMQDFTCDETKAKYPNSPHHPQHPPVHPLLHRGLSSSLLLLSPPSSSSSSSARTRPPLQRSGWAHRGCSPLTVEHRAARRTAGKHSEQHRGAGQGALPFLFLTATWEFLWTTTKKEKEKKKKKKNRKKKKEPWNLWGTEDDLSGQHGISDELSVPPLLACCFAAGWVPPPKNK